MLENVESDADVRRLVHNMPLMAVTGHNYVKKSGMSPVPRLIIIGVMEPLTRLKNCAQRNSITGNTVMGDYLLL